MPWTLLSPAALALVGAAAGPAAADDPPPDPRGYRGPAAVPWSAAGPAADTHAATEPDATEPSPDRDAAQPEGDGPRPARANTTGPRRTIVIEPRTPEPEHRGRAASVVTRRDLDERLPRSAPDAIRYEPGVYIQQTAHAQASPYVRGVTGQQVALYFDDVRLNNSTFRQGPNQYFFTVDSRTLRRLEVVRGSASTDYGSDAIGGAILSTPIDPTFDRKRKFTLHPRVFLRTDTSDGELGGRAQVDAAIGDKVGLIAGVGYRDLDHLRAGGQLTAPGTGMVEKIPPHFDSDGKTQLGTGFRELTADARLVARPAPGHELVAAYYDYRQFDAPRTDKCPAPEAPLDSCLTYDEQFRTLGYASWRMTGGPAAARTLRWTVHGQRQHELRTEDRGQSSSSRLGGRDDVYGTGTRLALATKRFEPSSTFGAQIDYGVDTYVDVIRSRAWIYWTDTQILFEQSRGQYLDRARYAQGGAWAQGHAFFWKQVELRAGGRAAYAHARADGDAPSDSAAVRRTWGAAVGNAGLIIRPWPWLALVGNVDQGFRAPNLDDLTSRQQTGPGFQRENADLDPERSVTFEGGLRLRHPWIEADGYVYQLRIRDLIQRRPFDASDCPTGDPGCDASRTRFQLQNAPGVATVLGAEGALRLFLPWDLFARATISWARGDMANPTPGSGPDRVPMSRIPPLNGTAEAGWRSSRFGVYLAGAVRWATLQDRLAPADLADPRIPTGGTPGYAVFDLRAGYRLDPYVVFGLVLANVGDAAYRTHGSSINGAGRSLMVNVTLGW